MNNLLIPIGPVSSEVTAVVIQDVGAAENRGGEASQENPWKSPKKKIGEKQIR